MHMTEVLRIPGLSDETRQRLPSLMTDLAEIRETVDPCLLHTGAAWDDESIWDYMVRKLGEKGAIEFTNDWVDVAWLYWWGYKARETSKIAMLALVAQQDKRWIDPPESGQSLPDYCLPLIQKHYPDLTADAIDNVVVRGGDGLVIINAGLPSAMAEFIRVQEEERHGLYYVGEYLSHAHTGGACASGRSIARLIMKHWA